MFSIKNNSSGFTLVELMIAMTLFGMMSIMVMTIYFSTTDTTRRLNAQRELAETAREIVERIQEDVREKGFSGDMAFDNNYDLWKSYDYTGSGSEYLNLKNGRYVYGKKTLIGMIPCIDTSSEKTKTDPKIHCGLYLIGLNEPITSAYNLVDSFNPDESRKRVKIENLRFYASGDGVGTAHKVMMNMDLSLMPRNGISESLASTTKLHIQTTISERGWRK